MATPNLWGLRGTEDLGGGTKAVFELINQFNLGTGAIYSTNGGSLFSRNAFVGLANDRFGKLTFGQQYEFMVDSLLRFDNSSYIAGIYGFRQGPFANLGIPGNPSGSANFDRMAGAAMSNAVKYTSPLYQGLSIGALYSFGGQPGSLARNDGKSFGINYAVGPVSLGAAYTYQRYTALGNGMSGIRNYGAGAEYRFGDATANVLYTNTKNTANNATINVYQIGVRYQFSPALSAGGDYELMKGNTVLAGDKANQFSLGVRYVLSKRTFVYTEAVYQKVSRNNAPHAWIMAVSGPSGNDRQMLTRLGMVHRF
ncbi:porin [Paraburkholderia sp. MMS20-SJTR3]|uniref:Porin n=1 Tax=Paraburkholderia sejongensis TaxID=2886946 RepID=A0ABS8JYP2_9BURK|nr:porin [Paraburkholderia sp. MMS20-SJTR3]MCC8394764.1 porin [Paraburkholderia sp. MMS20-SJTR3]